jgi:hypothetical protein
MRRLDLDQLTGEFRCVVPVGGGGLEQEGLLHDQLVTGVLGKSGRIKGRSGDGVVIAARDTPGQVVAEQRTLWLFGRSGAIDF